MIDKIQIICNDFKESLDGMPYESVGRLFMALMAFANDEDPTPCLEDDITAKTLFPVMKQHIIRNEEYRKAKSESGKKGGSKSKQTKANVKQNEANTKQTKAPNLTLPNLTNNNIPTVYKPNQFTAGMLVQDYDFKKLEDKKVRN